MLAALANDTATVGELSEQIWDVLWPLERQRQVRRAMPCRARSQGLGLLDCTRGHRM